MTKKPDASRTEPVGHGASEALRAFADGEGGRAVPSGSSPGPQISPDEEEQIEPARWVVEPGDLWELALRAKRAKLARTRNR